MVKKKFQQRFRSRHVETSSENKTKWQKYKIKKKREIIERKQNYKTSPDGLTSKCQASRKDNNKKKMREYNLLNNVRKNSCYGKT